MASKKKSSAQERNALRQIQQRQQQQQQQVSPPSISPSQSRSGGGGIQQTAYPTGPPSPIPPGRDINDRRVRSVRLSLSLFGSVPHPTFLLYSPFVCQFALALTDMLPSVLLLLKGPSTCNTQTYRCRLLLA